MIGITSTGSFDKSERFLKRMSRGDIFNSLNRYGQEGINALAAATPVESGLTAASWGCTVTKGFEYYRITWTNSNIQKGIPIAIILQYGHGTGTGGYVQGRDYINPAIRPIFDRIAEDVWKVVTSA